MTEDIPQVLLDTWRVYERHDRMVDAALEAGVSVAMFKKRLRDLYARLGTSMPGSTSAPASRRAGSCVSEDS